MVRISDLDETLLARAAVKGDADAFGELVLRHALSARRVVRAILGSEDEADDIVQEASLAAWMAVERFDPTRLFRPWFMRIVANAALDTSRRRRVRKAEPLDDSYATTTSSPEQVAEASVLRDRLNHGLEALPERQRIALVLFDAEGYSHREIAEVLKVPEGTVRSYVFHARRALRRSWAALMGGTS